MEKQMCILCHKAKPLGAFYKMKSRKSGRDPRCIVCFRNYYEKYRRSSAGKAARARAETKYETTNPERRIAWRAASRIVREPCEVCSNPKAQRHHPDPHKPKEIVFLCSTHHTQAHGRAHTMVA